MKTRSYYEAKASAHRTAACLYLVLTIAALGGLLAGVRYLMPVMAISSAVGATLAAFAAGHRCRASAECETREIIRRRASLLKP